MFLNFFQNKFLLDKRNNATHSMETHLLHNYNINVKKIRIKNL